MLQLIFKKWWLILTQGILLIFVSIYIFNNPIAVLAGLSFWVGLLIFIAGILGIIAWFSADKSGKESMSLFWALVTTLFGIWLLLNLTATMKTLTILFGIWMLLTGIHLIQLGWSLKKENALGWVMVIAGSLAAIAGLMMVFDIGAGAVGISTLLGIQILLAGIALVILSFAKRSLVGIAKSKLEEFHMGVRSK